MLDSWKVMTNKVVWAIMKLMFKFSFLSFLTGNPRPTNVTSVEEEYMNLKSDYSQKSMKRLICRKTYTS